MRGFFEATTTEKFESNGPSLYSISTSIMKRIKRVQILISIIIIELLKKVIINICCVNLNFTICY